jgi:Cna protein B-type domain.
MFRYTALFALLMLPLLVQAQQVTGSISGTVTDPSASAIPGATVLLTSEQTGTNRTIETDKEGNFTIPAVPPGMYTLSVEHTGFKKLQKQQIELTPGGTSPSAC